MTWEGYWLPQLISWLGSAVVGLVVAVAGRRVLRVWFAQLLQTGEHAQQAAISASQAGEDASRTLVGQAELARRLRAVEGLAEGIREDTSASLAHRARADLRFTRAEDRLQALEQQRRGST